TEDLLHHLTALTGEREAVIGGEPYTILTRYAQMEGLQKAAQYLLERYAEWGIPAQRWHFSTYGWDNIVAELPGWEHPERVHILCAHYDSTNNHGDPRLRAPGADDNGSGTVTLLIAAHILRQYAFRDTIRFVHFSAEEQGLWGSFAYAHHVAWEGEEVVDVLNLDMVAWDGKDGPDMDLHAKDPASQEVADTFAEVIAAYGLDLVPDKRYGAAATEASDHSPFWHVGIPAVLAIENYEPRESQDFNPHYHSADDLVANLQPPNCANCLAFFTTFARATLGTVAHRAGLLPEGTPSPTPTATPMTTPTPSCPNHLPDGDFERGLLNTAWTLHSPQGQPLITQDNPHTGAWSAELGSQVYSRDRISQEVALPSGATGATLSAWWYLETNEWNWWVNPASHPNDRLHVEVLDEGGALLAELETLTEEYPQGRWSFSQWDLSPYVGRTVQVRFRADTNTSYVSRFFLDDVALRYCGGETPTPTATPTATSTPTATPTPTLAPPAPHRQYLPWMQQG
ncbi:MAG: Zn-dependent exopeptidase M28, partial [Anaerolineae bacterium]|nr:Zn-dependent exopeptidase M28 [Anaerolineae bacterium]